MPLEDGDRLVHRSDVLWADVAGEVVLYDPVAGRAHLLSATGSVLWPALSSPVAITELAGDVAEVFGISVADAASQIGVFCEDLLAIDVLVVVDKHVSGA